MPERSRIRHHTIKQRPIKPQRTYQARIHDPDGTLDTVLGAYADLYGQAERALFADLARGCEPAALRLFLSLFIPPWLILPPVPFASIGPELVEGCSLWRALLPPVPFALSLSKGASGYK